MPVAVVVSRTSHNCPLRLVASASHAAWQLVAPLALPASGPPTVMSVVHIFMEVCA